MKLKTTVLYDANGDPIIVNEKDVELYKTFGYSNRKKKSSDNVAAEPKVKKDKVSIED